MPVAVAWVGGIIAAGGIGAAIATTTINLLVSTAITYGLSRMNRPRQPKPREIQTQIRSGSAERLQHFGRVRTSGALMYADWANVGGDRRAFVLLAISTGGVAGVDQWYLDGRPVEVNGAGWVQTDPWKGRVRLRLRTGRDNEYAGGDWADLRSAFPMRWTGAHRLDGVATILGEFSAVKPENVQDVYPGGRPPEISAVIRGVPCWEPATGNASFTDNPIRHLLHYLSTEGMGTIPASEFDLAIFDAARLACTDALPTAGGTRPRYTGGGSIGLAEPMKDGAARILQGVAGALYLTQAGLIGVRVGKYQAPTAVIDESKIVAIDYGPGKPALDRITTLVPEYVEPSLDYTETTADPWEDARAIARFGAPKPQPLSLPWVQHHGQARALAKIEAARQNPQLAASVSLRFWGLRLLGEERVFLHLPARGIDMLPMRITGMSLDLDAADGVVKVELESEAAASFSWTAAQEGARPSAPARVLNQRPDILAPVITGVSVANAVISATVAPTDGYVVRAQFRPTGGPWAELEVNQATGFFRTPPLVDGVTYEIRARWVLAGLAAVGGSGDDLTRRGPWTTLTGIVAIANGTPPAPPVLVSASRSGSTITIVFQPDLGANYALTQIRRGAAFAGAEIVRTVRDQASTVTVQITDAPAPATYWLRSGNGSGITSEPLNIGTL